MNCDLKMSSVTTGTSENVFEVLVLNMRIMAESACNK